MDGGGETEASRMQIKSVYHSLDSILCVLNSERVKSLNGVAELLAIFHSSFPEGLNGDFNKPRNEMFVVFEGLDGCGKSTISRKVANALKGANLATPPSSISHLRTVFDDYTSDVRRAFYSLGNYIAAKEIFAICEEKPVYLDRFWHSTAAYGLAHEFGSEGVSALPPVGDSVYKWPKDLLKPDVVLFLDVDEEARIERHARRRQTTVEEDQLVKDEAFRKLVLAAYERMDDVPVVHVNSSVNIKNTVSASLFHAQQFLCKIRAENAPSSSKID